MMKNVYELKHPLLKRMLSKLRNKDTLSAEFRNTLNEISRMICYEATQDLQTKTYPLETPLAKTTGTKIADNVMVVAILRAGMGMVDGALSMLPFASVGHIGIYRDKFINNTVEYYFRLPADHEGRPVLLLDPMLATADTALAALDRLKQYEVGKIKFLCILASKHGIDRIHALHPEVDIYTLSIEPELNEKGYLIPGLGDAGDRLYSTVEPH
jgi:uracil phosphoribosyltransferase